MKNPNPPKKPRKRTYETDLRIRGHTPFEVAQKVTQGGVRRRPSKQRSP